MLSDASTGGEDLVERAIFVDEAQDTQNMFGKLYLWNKSNVKYIGV